jgi:hypothetical protein
MNRLSHNEAAPAVYKAILSRRIGIAVFGILAFGNQSAKPQTKNSFDDFALLDKSGNMREPADYRDLYREKRMQMNSRRKHRGNGSVQTTRGGGQ